MTREEFRVLQAALDKLVDLAVDNNKPSLPPNLDEAAKHYSEHTRFHWPNQVKPYYDAFKAGAEWQKRKMMEGAVEGEVCGRCYGHLNIRFADGVYKYLEPQNISHIPADVSRYNIGDKVKIIIVKEKEQ